MKLILASKSPQRKNILDLINLDFIIKDSNVDENNFNINHRNPNSYCKRLAYEKAKNISINYKKSLVIGADTIVYHNNKIIGKPENKKKAFSTLQSLRILLIMSIQQYL